MNGWAVTAVIIAVVLGIYILVNVFVSSEKPAKPKKPTTAEELQTAKSQLSDSQILVTTLYDELTRLHMDLAQAQVQIASMKPSILTSPPSTTIFSPGYYSMPPSIDLKAGLEELPPIEEDLIAYKLFVVNRGVGCLSPLTMTFDYDLLGENDYRNKPLLISTTPITVEVDGVLSATGHGFYSFKGFKQACLEVLNETNDRIYAPPTYMVSPVRDYVIAKVRLWGRTVFCEYGYMSEFFEFLELHTFDEWPDTLGSLLGWPGTLHPIDKEKVKRDWGSVDMYGIWTLREGVTDDLE